MQRLNSIDPATAKFPSRWITLEDSTARFGDIIMAMRDTRSFFTRTRTRTASSRKFNLGVLGSMVIVAAMLVSTMLVSQPAAAQTACGERADILKNLERVHSERTQALGLSADGKVLEVLVSPTGSWTILVNHPSRLTCLVAAGEGWERLPVLPTGPST